MTLLRALALASLLLAPLPAGARVEPAPTQRTMFSSGTPVTSSTAILTEQNLTCQRIPGNLIGRNGSVRVTALYSYTNSANTKQITTRLSTSCGSTSGTGSLLLLNNGQTTTNSAQALAMFWDAGSTSSQVKYASNVISPFASNAGGVVSSAIDTTQDTFINFNATVANGADTVTLVGYLVEIFPGS